MMARASFICWMRQLKLRLRERKVDLRRLPQPAEGRASRSLLPRFQSPREQFDNVTFPNTTSSDVCHPERSEGSLALPQRCFAASRLSMTNLALSNYSAPSAYPQITQMTADERKPSVYICDICGFLELFAKTA